MCESYHAFGEDDPSGFEDELFCEYVDGTMDPAVMRAFEDYLRANPSLAEYAERLRETRYLLCTYGCRCHAPDGFQHKVRRRLAREMMRAQSPLLPGTTAHLRALANFGSAMAVMMVVGMVLGAALFSEPSMHRPGAGLAESTFRFDEPSSRSLQWMPTTIDGQERVQYYLLNSGFSLSSPLFSPSGIRLDRPPARRDTLAPVVQRTRVAP